MARVHFIQFVISTNHTRVRLRVCAVLAGLFMAGSLASCPTASAQRQVNTTTQQPSALPVQQTAEQIAAQQHVQQVQSLIAKEQASYKSGVDNYNANRLDAARMDFDFAVDTMLSSGLDLKTDPVLSDEFERLLSAINSLEMVALQQGNGFTPKIESARWKQSRTLPSRRILNSLQNYRLS